MKSLQVLLLTALICSVAMGSKSARVCLYDGNTPLELADPCVPWVYRDIMVGTQLTLIVDSDEDGYWDYGELSIWDTNQNYADLAGRDYNEMTFDWEGSRFPEAGTYAAVWDFQEERLFNDILHDVNGFQLTADFDAIAGDWFIIDYNAINVGNCKVAFIDGFSLEPLYWLAFTHVPSRDFNEDDIVDFTDYAVLASYWGITDCTDPSGCGKFDLYDDDIINIDDIALFVDFWLERTN